jgi:hypothetical protein
MTRTRPTAPYHGVYWRMARASHDGRGENDLLSCLPSHVNT